MVLGGCCLAAGWLGAACGGPQLDGSLGLPRSWPQRQELPAVPSWACCRLSARLRGLLSPAGPAPRPTSTPLYLPRTAPVPQDIVDRAYRRAKDLVQQNIAVLHATADLLMEREQIDGEDLQVGGRAVWCSCVWCRCVVWVVCGVCVRVCDGCAV